MENKKSILKIFLITVMIYVMTLVTGITLNNEEDLSSLKNGPLLMILFYGQIILILINSVINKSKNIISLELKKILDIELKIKLTIFIIYNLILPNINIRFNSLIIYILLIVAFAINTSILIYSFKHIDKLTIKIKKEINNKVVNTNYSLSGTILYFIAIGLYGEITYILILKVFLFVLSINILSNNLKQYYNIINFKNKINLSLIVGAIINISIFIYLYFISSELDIRTLSNTRDISWIISALFIIPYLKKTQFINGL